MFAWLNKKSEAQFIVIMFGVLAAVGLIIGTVVTMNNNHVKNERANNCAAYGGQTYGKDNWLCVR